MDENERSRDKMSQGLCTNSSRLRKPGTTCKKSRAFLREKYFRKGVPRSRSASCNSFGVVKNNPSQILVASTVVTTAYCISASK